MTFGKRFKQPLTISPIKTAKGFWSWKNNSPRRRNRKQPITERPKKTGFRLLGSCRGGEKLKMFLSGSVSLAISVSSSERRFKISASCFSASSGDRLLAGFGVSAPRGFCFFSYVLLLSILCYLFYQIETVSTLAACPTTLLPCQQHCQPFLLIAYCFGPFTLFDYDNNQDPTGGRNET